MKRFCLMMGMLISVSTLAAQTIIGKWSAPELGLEMVLNPDLSYTFGMSAGRYTITENSIYFQDRTSGGATAYMFFLDRDILRFIDINGVPINFVRVPGQASSGRATGSGAVLAKQGGYTLTEGDVAAGVGVLQFIINGRVTDAERSALTEQSKKEFGINPEGFLKELQSLAVSRAMLSQVTDPIQVGLIRQALVVAFYQAAKNQPSAQLPLFVQVMNRYVQVLAYDEPNRLALTNKDLDAFFDYTSFLYELNTGKKVTWPISVHDSVKNDLITRFPTLPLQEKQFYCGMGVIWNYFQYAWKSAAEAQRAKIVQGMFAGNAAPTPAQGINYGSIQPQAGTSVPSGQEMDDGTFNTLKNVMLIDHVGTMNAWSAIGDSPYYYEIVDY